MIKVGVTGSNGFIGWHLCRTLELDINKFELIEFNIPPLIIIGFKKAYTATPVKPTDAA